MILSPGQHVKCILRNSTVIEGIVESWTTQQVQLKSLDQKSLLIIHHPAEDIVLTKVLLQVDEIPQQFESVEIQPPTVADEEKLDPMALRAKSIVELKIELARQERDIIAKKMKDHHPEAPRKVQYGYPQFLKKPST